jgi:hypothetical protein
MYMQGSPQLLKANIKDQKKIGAKLNHIKGNIMGRLGWCSVAQTHFRKNPVYA